MIYNLMDWIKSNYQIDGLMNWMDKKYFINIVLIKEYLGLIGENCLKIKVMA